ncbi:hypothetical protein DhcVS_1345 [Dehalococcoides mccartyi VS]|uniref:Uncharacterized protein n=1 Tax=Dehalococcoides mccartyi (strain VS) TaxID=311424 RepID=D2BJE4_DEHMV|nr:hypothetical protein DhcVS_1345 [Dehalococcoides mccartyi VS]
MKPLSSAMCFILHIHNFTAKTYLTPYGSNIYLLSGFTDGNKVEIDASVSGDNLNTIYYLSYPSLGLYTSHISINGVQWDYPFKYS